MTIHRNEKRLGRVLHNKNQFSCLMYKATPVDRRKERPHLLYEMSFRYCIKCANEHWFLGERIELELTEFNPNDYFISELYEMGYFDQFDDTDRPKD